VHQNLIASFGITFTPVTTPELEQKRREKEEAAMLALLEGDDGSNPAASPIKADVRVVASVLRSLFEVRWHRCRGASTRLLLRGPSVPTVCDCDCVCVCVCVCGCVSVCVAVLCAVVVSPGAGEAHKGVCAEEGRRACRPRSLRVDRGCARARGAGGRCVVLP
jgi:hypothetical protein